MVTSEIHNLIALQETPSGIRALLEEFVKEFESQNSMAWNKEVKATDKKYHCHTLLKKGVGEISVPMNKKEDELSVKELACLFNYYYFPIQFESTYEIYKKIWDSKFEHYFIDNNALIFIDLGCASLPSSLAFSEVYKIQDQIISIWGNNNYCLNSYVFIDSSWCFKTGINNFTEGKPDAREFKRHRFFNISPIDAYKTSYYPMTDIFHFSTEINIDNDLMVDNLHLIKIKELYIKNALMLANDIDCTYPFHKYVDSFNKNKSVILNINYFRSVEFINNENLLQAINKIFAQNPNLNFTIIFQNNGNEVLESMWEFLKSKLSIRSINRGFFDLKINTKIRIEYEVLFKSEFE